MGTLDVSAQTFVVANFHLFAIVVEVADGVEMMIAAEACCAIALDDIEQQSLLGFPRIFSEIVPSAPLPAGYEGRGFEYEAHDRLSVYFDLFGGETL